MPILQKSVQVNIKEIDTSLIYSRVIAMKIKLTNAAMAVENVFMPELAQIQTPVFTDDGDLRPPVKSKADLKRNLESKASTRTINKLELAIVDGSAIL